jgi:hypothetical protein
MIQRHHMSSKIPSASGGVSTTIGPDARSTMPMKYTVSAFAVTNSDSDPSSSENIRISLSFAPTS